MSVDFTDDEGVSAVTHADIEFLVADTLSQYKLGDSGETGIDEFSESIRTDGPRANQARITLFVMPDTVTVSVEIQQWDLDDPGEMGDWEEESVFVPGETVLGEHGDVFEEYADAVWSGVAKQLELKCEDIGDAVIESKEPEFVCDGSQLGTDSPTALIRYVCVLDSTAFFELDGLFE